MKWLKQIIINHRCRKGRHDLEITRIISINAQELKCKNCGKEFLEESGATVPLSDRIRYLANNQYRRFDTAAYLLNQNVKEPKR
ncbi:MAG: hypothetical protein AB9835_14395 [Eubacteriales bacterium]